MGVQRLNSVPPELHPEIEAKEQTVVWGTMAVGARRPSWKSPCLRPQSGEYRTLEGCVAETPPKDNTIIVLPLGGNGVLAVLRNRCFWAKDRWSSADEDPYRAW